MAAAPMNMVMTVIGFAVSCLFMVFVCTRLVGARIRISATRRSLPVSSRSNLGPLEKHGLTPTYASSFPTKKFGSDIFSASLNVMCTVCLAEYQLEETLRILPHCGHSFHALCIDRWLRKHSTCPICRVSLHESRDMNLQRIMPPLRSSAMGASRDELGQLEDSNQMGAFNVTESIEEDDESREENQVRKQSLDKRVESPSTL